jgi:hypothetical protein
LLVPGLIVASAGMAAMIWLASPAAVALLTELTELYRRPAPGR